MSGMTRDVRDDPRWCMSSTPMNPKHEGKSTPSFVLETKQISGHSQMGMSDPRWKMEAHTTHTMYLCISTCDETADKWGDATNPK